VAKSFAIDYHNGRVYVVYTGDPQVYTFPLDGMYSQSARQLDPDYLSIVKTAKLSCTDAIAVDQVRKRLLITDIDPVSRTQRVHVLSTIDYSHLFTIDRHTIPSRLVQPGQNLPFSDICVDNHGRIIVVDLVSGVLVAFAVDGTFLSVFKSTSIRYSLFGTVAFDERRGLIAYTIGRRVDVIEPNAWLPGTYIWQPNAHRYAPRTTREAVLTTTMIRSLVHESPLALMPNELLFEIFGFL
jgi:hypothetical protein